MALSALTAQLRSKGVKLSIVPNYKTYYGGFPHIIRFYYKNSKSEWATVRSLHKKLADSLLKKVDSSIYRTRSEYYNMNIYCYDIIKVLKTIPTNELREWARIEVGEMTNEVQEESSIKPELPKAKTTVVKKLPFNTWRYRVHWAPAYSIVKKIGQESLNAIVDHINTDENTKHLNEKTTQRLKRGNFWGTSYFYTNSEDVLCLITLISPLFIKKIEKFTTLEEINEKRTG